MMYFQHEKNAVGLKVGFRLKANVPEKGLALLEEDFQGRSDRSFKCLSENVSILCYVAMKRRNINDMIWTKHLCKSYHRSISGLLSNIIESKNVVLREYCQEKEK